MSTVPETTPGITLRDLPLAARIVLSAFLISVGIGYSSALVQLHFQHARPGELMPTKQDAERIFHGTPSSGTLERLIRADENLPFTGSGSMRAAFFKKSAGWAGQVNKKERALKLPRDKAELALRKEREKEIDAVLLWLKQGATEKEYESLALSPDFFKDLPEPLENDFFVKEEEGKVTAKVGEIFTARCARCHDEGKGGAAGQVHLANWEQVKVYVPSTEEGGSSGMSLTKLAQTTHVHLLGFSMLYGLTGLILAFSSYPSWLKVIVCPLPLLAQVIDISFWWTARIDPMFAHFIIYSGGVVAMGLMLHIVLSLLNMYGIPGKLALLVMFGIAGGGAFFLKTQVIDPYLVKEKGSIVVPVEK